MYSIEDQQIVRVLWQWNRGEFRDDWANDEKTEDYDESVRWI